MEDTLSFFDFSLEIVIPKLLPGLWLTLQLTLISAILGMLLGVLLALLRISKVSLLSWPALIYTTCFRGTPLLLQVLFIYFALPQLLDWRLDSYTSGILALSLNCAAYFAEIFRAAIESIPRGQMEAARALGLPYIKSMRLVIVPQTYRRLIPPVVNELAALSKDTSLVSVIALSDLLYATQRVSAAFLRPWEAYFWAAIGYLIIVLALTTLASNLEKRLKIKENSP